MKDQNARIGGALTVVLLFVLLWVTLYVPLASAVSVWLIPLPLMYAVSKSGWRFGSVLLVLGVVFLLLIQRDLSTLFPIFFIILGFVMGETIRLKKSAFAVLLTGSLANIIMLILCLAGSVLIFGFNPVVETKTAIERSLESMVGQAGPLLHQNAGTLLSMYRSYLNYLGNIAPSLIVMIGVVYASIIEWISLPILRRFRIKVPEWVPFRRWQEPKSVVWIYLIALLLIQTGLTADGDPLFIIAINIAFVMQILLVIQGLSFIFCFASHRRLPVIVPAIVTVAVIIFSFLLLQLVTLLGIIDLGFDLRKRLDKKK